jgi:hypothetical protein
MKKIEIFSKFKSSKNGETRIVFDNNKDKHLEYFMNGSWRHSPKCKENTNKVCDKIQK